MTIATAFSGTAAISTTEFSLTNASVTLATRTAPGIYQVFVDLATMVAGDSYRITIYETALAAGVKRVAWTEVVNNLQAAPMWVSPSMLLMNGWEVTMTRLAGVDRSIVWSIRSVA